MREINKQFPYKLLGSRLKQLREKLQESLAEASGAVEIELDELNRIEQGSQRPSEDVLLLLISHFALKEDEAMSLWELAEYDRQDRSLVRLAVGQDGQPAVVPAGSDVRINYTDMVHIVANKYGVVLNFMQGSGPDGQPLVVARLGMSREHAAAISESLNKALSFRCLKSLPAPRNNRGTKKPD